MAGGPGGEPLLPCPGRQRSAAWCPAAHLPTRPAAHLPRLPPPVAPVQAALARGPAVHHAAEAHAVRLWRLRLLFLLLLLLLLLLRMLLWRRRMLGRLCGLLPCVSRSRAHRLAVRLLQAAAATAAAAAGPGSSSRERLSGVAVLSRAPHQAFHPIALKGLAPGGGHRPWSAGLPRVEAPHVQHPGPRALPLCEASEGMARQQRQQCGGSQRQKRRLGRAVRHARAADASAVPS